uniref:Uncharacterized protein n=1 Tax=Oryza punctata TaxID=4537 RepID=A0A0E0KGG1_ORYPU
MTSPAQRRRHDAVTAVLEALASSLSALFCPAAALDRDDCSSSTSARPPRRRPSRRPDEIWQSQAPTKLGGDCGCCCCCNDDDNMMLLGDFSKTGNALAKGLGLVAILYCYCNRRDYVKACSILTKIRIK